MNTLRTEEFAKVCKELSTYFFDVAPEPRKFTHRENDYEEEYISPYDNLKNSPNSGNVPQPPIGIELLRRVYLGFNEEIEENVEKSDFGFVTKLVIHLLDNCLPYEKKLPVEEQFFRERMFEEAELLYTFKSISREINQRFGAITLMGDPLPF